jgi:glycosidase
MKNKSMKKIYLLLPIISLLFHDCSTSENSPANDGANFTVPATEDIVMYEINIGSFSPDKNLQGITSRLDNIEALGINTIWLMPIYPIGNVNSFGSPYCVKDYMGVNAQLGSLEDVKTLVTQAHKRKIAVILDWVANHTAWDNAWITLHPDWYTHDSSGQIISPPGTNWSDVADLNYDNSQMRLEMISSMAYWISQAGVDGFRCDAADLIPFDFWQQAITSLRATSGRDIIMLAEGSRNDHFTAGFQMNFAWDWYNAVKNVFVENAAPQTLYSTNAAEYLPVPTGNKKLRFTTNHDLSNELTPIGVFTNKQAALAASVATIFMDGAPLIYSGQEVGVSVPTVYTSGQAIDWDLNPDMLSAYTGLLQFYKNSDVAKNGTVTSFTNPDVVIFTKTLGNTKLLVLVNTRSTSKTVVIPASLQTSWQNALTGQSLTLFQNLQLNAYGYLILKKI